MGHSLLQYLKLKLIVSWLRLKRYINGLTLRRPPSNSLMSIHPGVAFQAFKIPSRDKGRGITIHSYVSANLATSEKPLPVLINLHGSGFIYTASLGKDREFCSLVAARTRAHVLDADYRKAPEHPFPSALHDFQDVLTYVRAHPSQYDLDHVLVSGFSSGGNLVLGGSLADAHGLDNTANDTPPIRAVLAFYPSVDLTKPHRAPDSFEPGTGHAGHSIGPREREIFYECYLPPGSPSRGDYRISPTFGAFQIFPPFVYITCGSADTLYNPCAELAQKLKGSTIDGPSSSKTRVVRFLRLDGEDHGFDKSAGAGTIAEQHKIESYESAIDVISQALDS